MSKLSIVLFALAACLGSRESARAAEILYDNLNDAPGSILGTFPIGNPAQIPDGQGPEGDSFSTGASPFLLSDVVLKLQGAQDSGTFSISLFSDNDTSCGPGLNCSGGPLTLLYTIATGSDNSLSTSLANYDFSLASPQTLAANTRYWIIASSTDGSDTLWSYTEDLSGTGVAGEFNIVVQKPSSLLNLLPNGADPDCYMTPSGANACTPFQMEVAGTAVPEPDTYGLTLIGLGLLGFMRCRFRM